MAGDDDIEKNGLEFVEEDALSSVLADSRRVRYLDDDDIRQIVPALHRTKSTRSIRSLQNTHRRSIDPSVALPIQYRTLSYNLEGSQRAAQVKDIKESSDELTEVDWHILSEAEICKKLNTDLTFGLSDEQVKSSLTQWGANLPSPPPSRLMQKMFGYFSGGFGAILLTGGVLVFISWKPPGDPPARVNLALAIVLIVVFLLQAAFNAWQDFSSSRVMKSITGMLIEECHVMRNGQKMTVKGSEIVSGDMLLFKAGTVPASLSLTGIGLFSVEQYDTGRTPLQAETIRFVSIIVTLMVTMNVVVISVGRGYIRRAHPECMPVASLIVDIGSVAIAFVPEGLPIALTASLEITASIMRKNNILCKSVKTVETLGAVSILLSDKTETLTKNVMTITDVFTGLTQHTLDEARQNYDRDQYKKAALEQLRVVAAINNAGDFDPTSMHRPLAQRKITADATDAALLRFSEMLEPVIEARDLWRKRFDLASNSKSKFAPRVHSANKVQAVQSSLSDSGASSFDHVEDLCLTIKGAPDVLLPRCTAYVGEDGCVHELTDAHAPSSE